jgi:choline transport protein
MIVFINVSTIYVLVALLVRTHPKASAHTVFVDVLNASGWSSKGLVFFLCFLPGSISVACFDTAGKYTNSLLSLRSAILVLEEADPVLTNHSTYG